MDFARKRWISRVREINLPKDKNGSPKRQKWNGGVFSDPTQTNKFGGKTWTFFWQIWQYLIYLTISDFDNFWQLWQFLQLRTWSLVNLCWHDMTSRVTLDQSVTNIFEYSNIQIFLIQIFIRVLVRIIFWIRIYSDICSCQLFGYKYVRIFVRGKILIRIYSDIRSYQFSGHKQIQKMFLLIFSGYYTLLMDILLISMIKNAI